MTKTIVIQPEGVFTSEPMPIMEIVNITLGNLLGLTIHTTKDLTQEEKEHLYDKLNDMFSYFLEQYIPDKELRPDITIEAIQEIEDRKIKEQLASMQLKNAQDIK